jgi:hypothetical protein
MKSAAEPRERASRGRKRDTPSIAALAWVDLVTTPVDQRARFKQFSRLQPNTIRVIMPSLPGLAIQIAPPGPPQGTPRSIGPRQHRRRQHEERLKLGAAWTDYDLVFATAAGTPLAGGNVYSSFQRLQQRVGLPAARLAS